MGLRKRNGRDGKGATRAPALMRISRCGCVSQISKFARIVHPTTTIWREIWLLVEEGQHGRKTAALQ